MPLGQAGLITVKSLRDKSHQLAVLGLQWSFGKGSLLDSSCHHPESMSFLLTATVITAVPMAKARERRALDQAVITANHSGSVLSQCVVELPQWAQEMDGFEVNRGWRLEKRPRPCRGVLVDRSQPALTLACEPYAPHIASYDLRQCGDTPECIEAFDFTSTSAIAVMNLPGLDNRIGIGRETDMCSSRSRKPEERLTKNVALEVVCNKLG